MMSATVKCRQCGKALEIRDEWVGRQVRCPDCGAVFLVPEQPELDHRGEQQRQAPGLAAWLLAVVTALLVLGLGVAGTWMVGRAVFLKERPTHYCYVCGKPATRTMQARYAAEGARSLHPMMAPAGTTTYTFHLCDEHTPPVTISHGSTERSGNPPSEVAVTVIAGVLIVAGILAGCFVVGSAHLLITGQWRQKGFLDALMVIVHAGERVNAWWQRVKTRRR